CFFPVPYPVLLSVLLPSSLPTHIAIHSLHQVYTRLSLLAKRSVSLSRQSTPLHVYSARVATLLYGDPFCLRFPAPPILAKNPTSTLASAMPARTKRSTTEESGKGKARANAPYPPSRQPSSSAVVPDSLAQQGMPLLRPPLAHKSSSTSSSGSSR
ncbi:hypothetical protein C8T65DRAFT_652441, partial [Cerioporus squamosus]